MPTIACPACSAINRTPDDKNPIQGKCGRCKGPLFVGLPLELNETSFESHVVKSSLPVVVDFWADWCGPCKMMAPVFYQAAVQLEPLVRLAKVDTEKEQAIAARYQIRSIPTLILFREGQEIDRVSGAMQMPQLIQWVQSHV